MSMDIEQQVIEIVKAFAKVNELTLEEGDKCFYLSELHCMMSCVLLKRCMMLATVLNARFYIGTSPAGNVAFIMYNVGESELTF